MRRGEVWLVEFDVLRPVVLLGGDETAGFQAIQVVPSADMDISGLGVEVPIGAIDGVVFDGVLRLLFPNPDFVFCTWMTSITAEFLIERVGVLPPGKMDEIDEAVRLCSQPRESSADTDATTTATARLNEIREALRRRNDSRNTADAVDGPAPL